MSVAQLRDFLRTHLLTKLRADVRPVAEQWLKSLSSDDDSDLLGYCVAIDIKNGSITPSVLEEIFRELRAPFVSARRAFAEAMAKCGATVRRMSGGLVPRSDPHPTYANVLDITAFVTSYVNPSRPYLTMDDIHRAKVEFFEDGDDERTLEDVAGAFEGPDGYVWVGPDPIYRRYTDDLGEDSATRLHDILGLSSDWRGEMVYIRYPSEFRPPKCRQPNCLDAGWAKGGSCFLSAAEGDAWGRTHGRAGLSEPIPERIHGRVEKLSEKFSAKLLGVPAVAALNFDALRRAAIERFARA